MGVYKYLMIYTSLFEICFSSLNVICKLSHYSYRTAAVTLMKITTFSVSTTLLLHAAYWGFFGSAIAIFSIHFIYRYLVVSESKLLKSFQYWKLVLWLLLPLLSMLVWYSTGYFLCASRPEGIDFVRRDFEETFKEPIGNYTLFTMFPYKILDDRSFKFNVAGTTAFVIIMISVSITLCTILFFGSKCYLRIRNLYQMTSTNTSSLEKQLFYALVAQTLVPVLLLQFPIGCMATAVLFEIGLGTRWAFVSVTVGIYPVVDPLPNVLIITAYRRAVINCLRCHRQDVVTPLPISASHTVQACASEGIPI